MERVVLSFDISAMAMAMATTMAVSVYNLGFCRQRRPALYLVGISGNAKMEQGSPSSRTNTDAVLVTLQHVPVNRC